MKTLAFVIALALLVLAAPLLFQSPDQATAPEQAMLPWQISVDAQGDTRVFGLTLGKSPLRAAQPLLKEPPQVAIVGRRDEPGSLEAFFDGVRLGGQQGLGGKMVLTLAIDEAGLQAMRQRAPKTDYMESATLRSTLAAADLDAAQNLPIRAIVFVPSARLDEAIVLTRFGQPGERIAAPDNVTHFLYPDRGLDVALNANGKAMLQYVAPRDFATLRAPLLAPSATAVEQAK